MLSPNLATNNGYPSKRTAQRLISRESLALRELRVKAGLTMRAAGQAIGKSDSYISHLENGRLDFPAEPMLERILQQYGGMKPKSFFERARKVEVRLEIIKQIGDHLERLSQPDLQSVLELIQEI